MGISLTTFSCPYSFHYSYGTFIQIVFTGSCEPVLQLEPGYTA